MLASTHGAAELPKYQTFLPGKSEILTSVEICAIHWE